MPHVEPLAREELKEFEPVFELVEGAMGFVPNSMLTLGRRPEILQGFAALAGSVLAGGTIEPELKNLVSYVASNAAGCNYCQAHTAHTATHQGADPAKIAVAFEFETNALFSEAERAALRLARDSALVPNLVTAEHFAALRAHFSEEQVVEIVAVCSLFGWLNRWNDTMATELESSPLASAKQTLDRSGWQTGKHAR